jgi:MFS family permease
MTAPAPSTDRSPARRGRRRIGPGPAFAVVAATFLLFMAAAAAPSPLYVVYQQQWSFSEATLTAVFAVYVLGLLGSLLVFGALSDHVGRRPVIAAAVALESLALVLFLVAGDVGVLAVARVLQGIATGAGMTALSAALVDLDPPHARGRAGLVNSTVPTAGLALGALVCGALVQFGPAPTHLVYALLLTGAVLAAVAVPFLPETVTRRPGALRSLRPRLSLPPRLRADVAVLVPVLVASWATGGLYLSLGPSVAAGLFGLQSHLVGGVVVSLLCATGALTSVLLRTREPRSVLTTADALLAVGMVISLVGVVVSWPLLAAAGTVVAGVGFGAAALGCFATLTTLAQPHERGELFAVVLVISYLAFSVPAVAAGAAATGAGLRPTVLVYGSAVVVLAVAALAGQRVIERRRAALAG